MKKIVQCLYILIFCTCFVQCHKVTRFIPTSKDDGINSFKDCRAFQDTPAWGLALAVCDNDVSRIDKILNDNPELVDFREPIWGCTVLMQSISNMHYEAFMSLLDHNADVNIQEWGNGMTAMHFAAHTDDVRYVEALLLHGAEINSFGFGTKKKHGRYEYVRTPLHDAVTFACYGKKDMTIVKYLVEHGADVNMCFYFHVTPLFEALSMGNYDLAIYLIESGANYTIPFIYKEIESKEHYTISQPVSIQEYLDDEMNKGNIEDAQYKKLIELISEPYTPRNIITYYY